MNRLTLRHLRLNRGRTAITVSGIVLSIAMICCVAGFVMSLRDLLLREIKERDGDYHVAYLGVSAQTAQGIASEDIFSTSYIRDSDTEGLSDIFLRMKRPGRDIEEAAGAIAGKYPVQGWRINSDLLALEGVIVLDSVLMTFVIIAAIAIAVIVVGSVVVIANAFYISSSERVRQFGLLKSVGATGGQLRRSVLFEAFILTAVAIPIGLVFGFLIQAAVLRLTNGLLTELAMLNGGADFAFRVVISPAVIGFSVVLAVITVLLSAWVPARRAAAASPIDAIRKTKDIAILSKRLKVSFLTRRLFGFEGALAAKSLKRSRGKYRATVVSLTLSIVMMISMSSFIWTLNKGMDMQYGGYDFDAVVHMRGSASMMDAAGAAIRSIPNAQIQAERWTQFGTAVPDGFITENAPQSITDDDGFGLLLHPMEDAEFEKILPPDESDFSGLLINNATFTRDDKKQERIPYDCEIGTELPLLADSPGGEAPSEVGRVTIGAAVNEIPESIPAALFDGSLINVFVSESAYRSLFTAYGETLAYRTESVYAVTVADPDAFCAAAEELLALIPDDDRGMAYDVQNVSQMTRLYRNLTLIVMLFGYGFIAMLSLIAVTSVVSTISTGMALRRQEFAMLYSVGMTPEGMDKMLNLESLLYGLKSLFIGVPLGVALSYLIHKGMSNIFVFAYELPFTAMLICAAAVMLLTFATMRYGKRKLKRISIVDALRNETA